jgi:hypothetical protein
MSLPSVVFAAQHPGERNLQFQSMIAIFNVFILSGIDYTQNKCERDGMRVGELHPEDVCLWPHLPRWSHQSHRPHLPHLPHLPRLRGRKAISKTRRSDIRHLPQAHPPKWRDVWANANVWVSSIPRRLFQ